MPKPQKDLWTLRLMCRPIEIEPLEALFEDNALALSSFDPPRAQTSCLDILADSQPDAAHIAEKLKTVFPDHTLILIPATEALAPLPDKTFKLSIAPVGNLDWLKKVAEDFPPLPVARWTVFGAAHREKGLKAPLPLQIDATSAFGTGEHPTTSSCLKLLDQLLLANPKASSWKMLDMGCGSGILAMAFAKACGGHALGVDMDDDSVEIARENAQQNDLANKVRFEISTGYALPLIEKEGPYDLIMANIFADPLCEMAADLKTNLKAGGFVILSGLLASQAEAVIAAHKAQGLILDQNMISGEWSALAFHAPAGS